MKNNKFAEVCGFPVCLFSFHVLALFPTLLFLNVTSIKSDLQQNLFDGVLLTVSHSKDRGS